ncbi:hypothetical protein BDM02DRAFT_3191889 [Thelephora ganbajun]|uniref:Uncharacterized protein n=1 Tax=Thelephora ganbajun TaxID=370292 RepID=A0ACB6Z1B9_THEGA|nr:hypothetical protein BDM02DRAFT_3191889 [Thelephora ganbajun]
MEGIEEYNTPIEVSISYTSAIGTMLAEEVAFTNDCLGVLAKRVVTLEERAGGQEVIRGQYNRCCCLSRRPVKRSSYLLLHQVKIIQMMTPNKPKPSKKKPTLPESDIVMQEILAHEGSSITASSTVSTQNEKMSQLVSQALLGYVKANLINNPIPNLKGKLSSLKEAICEAPASEVERIEQFSKAVKVCEDEVGIIEAWRATVKTWPVRVFDNDQLHQLARANKLADEDLHYHLSQNQHYTLNKAGVDEKLWDIFRIYHEEGANSKTADGVIESFKGVGNKICDCVKNPRAKELAVKALTVSDGFIGTPILDCNVIYNGLKSPETGVYQIMVHVMIDHLITILSPAPYTGQLSDARGQIQKITQGTQELAEELDKEISDYLSSGYEEYQVLQITPKALPEIEKLKDNWLAQQRSFLQQSKLAFSQIQEASNTVIPTWTECEWSALKLSWVQEGKDLPRYSFNLLLRDKFEALDAVFTSTYQESNQLLSNSSSALQKAKEYCDKIVETLQNLGLKYKNASDPVVANVWASAPVWAYFLLSPLPGHPIPLPLPTSSTQKKLYSELEKYKPTILMISWYFEPLQSYLAASTSTKKSTSASDFISSAIAAVAYQGSNHPQGSHHPQATLSAGLTRIWLSLLTSPIMDPSTLGSISSLFPTTSQPPSQLRTKWIGNADVMSKCKSAFQDLHPQHLASTVVDFRTSVATSSSFRTTSKSKDFTNAAACLAEVTSAEFRYSLRRQYDYTIIRQIRLLLALTIPLYATTMFPTCPQDMSIWKFWDRLDRRVGIKPGLVLGEPEHVAFIQKATEDISNNTQGLKNLYDHLLHHPLLSFASQTKAGRQIPDPVMGDAIYKLVTLAGDRLDFIRQVEMDEIGIKAGPGELDRIEIPECQIFPQWKHSEITSSKLPTLDKETLEKRREAGAREAKKAFQDKEFSIYFPDLPAKSHKGKARAVEVETRERRGKEKEGNTQKLPPGPPKKPSPVKPVVSDPQPSRIPHQTSPSLPSPMTSLTTTNRSKSVESEIASAAGINTADDDGSIATSSAKRPRDTEIRRLQGQQKTHKKRKVD